jgi:oxygen-independent coproporphyrinogen III oxidase
LAGIYLHIPFCKQACYYCDFHFSSYLALKSDLIDAMVKEIEWRKDYLSGTVETIYFGGGTPSLLDPIELEKLFTAISKNFSILPDAEITLEANPDDINDEKLLLLKEYGINRLSIGIQTFNDGLLKFLNRLHTSEEAIKGFEAARSMGFDNINCDLIFAIPGQDEELLTRDLKTMTNLGPEHISAYCLTIEERTVFGNWLKKNRFRQVDEDLASEQMEHVWDYLAGCGYDQYEISNFCINGCYSQHNSGYWKDKPYLGVGPGAHSYNGIHRCVNIGNNSIYIKAIRNGQMPFTMEHLSNEDQLNEYILTSLRTSWGCDLGHIQKKFGINLNKNIIEQFVSDRLLQELDNKLVLTRQGKLLADYISSKLFVLDIQKNT